MTDSEFHILRVVASGPVLVQGPFRIEMPDGSVVEFRAIHGGDLHVRRRTNRGLDCSDRGGV